MGICHFKQNVSGKKVYLSYRVFKWNWGKKKKETGQALHISEKDSYNSNWVEVAKRLSNRKLEAINIQYSKTIKSILNST